MNETTNKEFDYILISIEKPYLDIVEVLSFEDSIIGETTDLYYNKEFRWSVDDLEYSDWVDLTDENLSSLKLDPKKPFWIQYKYEQLGEGVLEFESIALEVNTINGNLIQAPQIKFNTNDNGIKNLNIECNGDFWNPYALDSAACIYDKLSTTVTNIFGHCVKYFKTKTNEKSKDVVLKEYSLFDVIKSDKIKIMVPDNEFPTRAIQFNPLMMDFPTQFEIHITKSVFQCAFGEKSRPEERDYLYFQEYLNKMYEIDSVAESDDFLYHGSYWRVSLVQYQQRTSVGHEEEITEEETKNIISSLNKFTEERDKELEDTRKPIQYNTVGTLSNDQIRNLIDTDLIITEERLYNKWTIISKYHYDLNSATLIHPVVYRNNEGWESNQNRAMSAWFRPKFTKTEGGNANIIAINETTDGKTSITFDDSNIKTLIPGDWIKIKGTQSYNTIHEIESISGNVIVLKQEYIDNVTTTGNATISKQYINKFLIYGNSNEFWLAYTHNYFLIKLNEKITKFDLMSEIGSFNNESWYSYIINFNNTASQLSLFIYKNQEIPNRTQQHSEIVEEFSKSISFSDMSLVSGFNWILQKSEMDLTNIRIWKSPLQEEEHQNILTQYVINDSHLVQLLDNAIPQTRLNKKTNPR